MPELIEQKVAIGRDRYGRPVTMIRQKDGGQWYWTIKSDPVNQRDDGELMRSLTDENIRQMTEALKVISP